jgi:hypothetical protein
MRIRDVHHRRLAGDGDRFFHTANPQLDGNGQRLRTDQLDALSLDRVEAGQRHSQRVSARPQVDDAVLASFISDCRPDFLNQCGARGFDGHAWQHAAGRVANGSREGRLGKYRCR